MKKLSKNAHNWAGDNAPLGIPRKPLPPADWYVDPDHTPKFDETKMLAIKGNCACYVSTLDPNFDDVQTEMIWMGWSFVKLHLLQPN